MTSKNQQIDLPEIPSLPPIQMPEATDFPSTLSVQPRRVRASLHPPQSSPFASQDTFQTARNSPDLDPNGNPTTFSAELLHPPSPHSLSSPTTLRKSISVDSFIKNAPPPSPATRSSRATPASSNAVPHQEVRHRVPNFSVPNDPPTNFSRVHVRERDKRAMPPPPTPSRSRGTSVSTNADDREGVSFFDESDMERSEDLSRRKRRSKATSRQIAPPPGELSLPPRVQSTSSFSQSTSQVPAPIVPVRSSSLTHKLAKQKSLASVDTHIPPFSQPPPITIAVIGATGCGKSTIIRKGLKAFALSEPVFTSFASGSKNDGTLSCTLRTGTVPLFDVEVDCVLRVLEIEISDLDLTRAGAEQLQDLSLDGVVLCYDVEREETFSQIVEYLREVAHMKLPAIALACKSDLESRVDPERALATLQQYDVGLIMATLADPEGKDKVRLAFEWVLKAICATQSPGDLRIYHDGYRNPASPAVLVNTGSTPPWDISRASSATPTAASAAMAAQSSITPHLSQFQTQLQTPPHSQPQSQVGTPMPTQSFHLPSPTSATSSRTPTTPTSPTRARSTSDLLSEHEKSRREEREQYSAGRSVALGSPNVRSRGSLNALSRVSGSAEGMSALDESHEALGDVSARRSRAPPWMTLDELLNKLLFMAVSDDDPVFVSRFLLTYRRFATPRSILLAMQKRMRALDAPNGDPMFACYAQMRICLLLDNWIHAYPTDFGVPGAAGALAALIKSILTKTYLLHYGAEFLPFLDSVPNLRDQDREWALKVDEESDDSSIVSDEEGFSALETRSSSGSSKVSRPPTSTDHGSSSSQGHLVTTRDRKSSLPLSAKTLTARGSAILSPTSYGDHSERTPKQILKRLVALSEDMQKIESQEIAQAITKIETRFFLQIKPRHWLQHVLVQGKKDLETDPVARYNHVANHIADWVVSLILCHDRPKARTRQIEKFVQVAEQLRTIHNYSALRAVIAGINSATFEGDLSLQLFQARSQTLWKHFQSFDQLLQSARSHQKYRMALRNSKGACIPALEVHLSDLIRAHEGNTDYHDDDHTKIHWAKFNMMAKFVDVVSQCQEGCRMAKDDGAYSISEPFQPPHYLLFERPDLLMDIDMQRSRIAPPDVEGADDAFKPLPPSYSREASRDAAILRKILFW